MRSGRDQGIVDQSALRMREATIAAGVWLTYAVCGSVAVYAACTWQHPHRAVITLSFAAAAVCAAIVSCLPRERIVRSRYREVFFLAWSMLDLALILLETLEDGGTSSPLALVLFLPVVFAAMSYPLASVVAVGGASVLAYLAAALAVGGAGWGYEAMFAVLLVCTCALSAWQARNHDCQRAALMEVSRADPLTGCLNRRGFEERATAEFDAAARATRQGAVLLLDVDRLKQVNDRHGHAAGDELLCWVVSTLRDTIRPIDAIGRLGGDEFAVLFGDIAPADALESARRIKRALGDRAPCSVGLATFPLDGGCLDELLHQADKRLYTSRHGRPADNGTGVAERLSWAATLAHAVDMRMNAEHEHSRAVADRAVAIAARLGWEPDMQRMLRIAAMLHDVGKVTLPDAVLCKPGELSAEEFEVIKGHSASGADLVGRIEGLSMIVPWVRHAHESFDGSGYPDGLSGQEIPQASRIMLVADAFDAITSTRPYREALPVEHARDELARYAGTQFDPECVRALLAHLDGERSALRGGFSVPA
jgi:diguanylate cyclase (GGDEF)-like protein